MSAKILYRILNADGVPCDRHGHPSDQAVYTNPDTVDRAIRQLNDPDYRSPGAPQPQGRPFRRDIGRVSWGNPL